MRKKLFVSTLVIVLIALTFSMLSVQLVFQQQFSDYLTKTNETTLEELPSWLSALYLSKGTWDPTSLDDVGHSLPVGTTVTLTDPSGKLIATLNSSKGSMMQHGPGGMGMGSPITKWKTKTITVSFLPIKKISPPFMRKLTA